MEVVCTEQLGLISFSKLIIGAIRPFFVSDLKMLVCNEEAFPKP